MGETYFHILHPPSLGGGQARPGLSQDGARPLFRQITVRPGGALCFGASVSNPVSSICFSPGLWLLIQQATSRCLPWLLHDPLPAALSHPPPPPPFQWGLTAGCDHRWSPGSGLNSMLLRSVKVVWPEVTTVPLLTFSASPSGSSVQDA